MELLHIGFLCSCFTRLMASDVGMYFDLLSINREELRIHNSDVL